MSPLTGPRPDGADMADATDHLWMHFTRMASYSAGEVPTIVRGEGAYVWDARGRRYLDGLAGLFVVNAGHGRAELAEAAAKQAGELAYFPSGRTPTRRRSSWPSGSPRSPPAT